MRLLAPLLRTASPSTETFRLRFSFSLFFIFSFCFVFVLKLVAARGNVTEGTFDARGNAAILDHPLERLMAGAS